ncbi:hypothetical protein [Rhodoligotrophos defluvii]|uniref:hypothetical protein n=1 Tax=Rhodoligotrophos defluvii TaxID=2561934 RepID=UPI0010C95DDD|nr:hypothetical protein [Rhodoligotrophos defluvii]
MNKLIGVSNNRQAKVFLHRLGRLGSSQRKDYATVREACDAALIALEQDSQVSAKIWVDGFRMVEQEEIADLRSLLR